MALRLFILLIGALASSLGSSAVWAEEALPVFDGTDGYRVLGPFQDGLLVQDRAGGAFLCDVDVANIVLLTACRPVMTPEEMDARVAAQAAAERRVALLEERDRLLALPEAVYEQAGRRTLSLQGCQVNLNRTAVLRSEVLPGFAAALKVPEALRSDLTRLLDDLFTQTLQRLLRKREITFDRSTRTARLVECDY